MDKHQILKAYYNYKKELLNGKKNVQVPERKYITIGSASLKKEEEVTLEGFSKRKYIKLTRKAD